jgi:hypothetical protein
MQQAVSHRVARPYTELAAMYDNTLGVPFSSALAELLKSFSGATGSIFTRARTSVAAGLFAQYLSRRWGVPTFAVDRSPVILAITIRNCTDCEVGLLQQDIRCLQLPQPVGPRDRGF